MIVTITSCAPVRALRRPTMPPQTAPPAMPASDGERAGGRPSGRSNEKPTQPAAPAAISIWPRPPMLNRPTRKASATPRPAAISGVAKLSVSVRGLMPAAKPSTPEVVDRALEQRGVGAADRRPERLEGVARAGEEVAGRRLDVGSVKRDQQPPSDERQHDGEHRESALPVVISRSRRGRRASRLPRGARAGAGSAGALAAPGSVAGGRVAHAAVSFACGRATRRPS